MPENDEMINILVRYEDREAIIGNVIGWIYRPHGVNHFIFNVPKSAMMKIAGLGVAIAPWSPK